MRKNIYYSLLLSALVTVSVAEETRQVDKHEHGVGELNIAIEKAKESKRRYGETAIYLGIIDEIDFLFDTINNIK